MSVYRRLQQRSASVTADDELSSTRPTLSQDEPRNSQWNWNGASRLLGEVYHTMVLSFKSLEHSPNELYINFILKFFESYSYFAISQILVIYLHQEFAISDMEAGTVYGMWGLAITLWGLATAWINDNLGVRRSLLLGFSISAVSTFALATSTTKLQVYLCLFVILPLGNSMGIPMLTVGIRRYTTAQNRGLLVRCG
jgi:hypothetical protein